MKKLLALIAALSAGCMVFSACGSSMKDTGNPLTGNAPSMASPDIADGSGYDESGFQHESIIEQGYSDVSKNPSSYFSLDRNTASYSHVRRSIEAGYRVESDSVRIEEMINYFDYDFTAPTDKAMAVTTALAPCPWNEENKLMLVGLKTTESALTDANANYVFLVDVSGSMSGADRLPLAKKGLNILLDGLGDKDVVSLVTYASGTETVLDGGECSLEGKEKIRKAISSLSSYGSTNGEGGLRQAYEIAQRHFIEGGNNRVIIISDGDFNVGINNTDDLKEFIQDKAKSKIYLSVIGVGMGNMRDDMLQTLATCGNGNYAYLDSEKEARKIFVDELKGNLYTVAKDAKAGITFTTEVEKYRLVGYDSKLIDEDDFNNEDKDTGEIGSNLSVCALYEIKLSDGASGKLCDVEVRYKDVSNATEKSDSVKCSVNVDTPSSDDLSFISCVAEFGLILRNSQYKGTASIASVLERLNTLSGYVSNDEAKKDFISLVGKASEIQG